MTSVVVAMIKINDLWKLSNDYSFLQSCKEIFSPNFNSTKRNLKIQKILSDSFILSQEEIEAQKNSQDSVLENLSKLDGENIELKIETENLNLIFDDIHDELNTSKQEEDLFILEFETLDLSKIANMKIDEFTDDSKEIII